MPSTAGQGLAGAHEKGGVEGQIGYFRRNHLVPVPEVDSLAELNQLIDIWDAADDARRIRSRPRTIGEMFAVEQPLLAPLPVERFETGRWFNQRVYCYAQITVRTNHYSVPGQCHGSCAVNCRLRCLASGRLLGLALLGTLEVGVIEIGTIPWRQAERHHYLSWELSRPDRPEGSVLARPCSHERFDPRGRLGER
jgi:hypothetical protein